MWNYHLVKLWKYLINPKRSVQALLFIWFEFIFVVKYWGMIEQFPKLKQTPEEAYKEISEILNSLYDDFGDFESLEKEWADKWYDVDMMIQVCKNEDLPEALKKLKEFSKDFRENYKKA